MSTIDSNYLFLRFLTANLSRLQKTLLDNWGPFVTLLEKSLVPLRASGGADIRKAIEEAAWDFASPASQLLQELARKVPDEAKPGRVVKISLHHPEEPGRTFTLSVTVGDVADAHRVESEAAELLRQVEAKQERPREGLSPGSLSAYAATDWEEPEETHRSIRSSRSASVESEPAAPSPERQINVWISERDQEPFRPLEIDESYTLQFQFAPPRASSLVSGPEAEIPLADIPDQGLQTEWVVTSTDVEMESPSPDVSVTLSDGAPCWTAKFSLLIPRGGSSQVRAVTIRPRSGRPKMSITIFTRREVYRELTVALAVDRPAESPAQVEDEEVHAAAGHLDLQTTHEWTTPNGHLSLTVPKGFPIVVVRGDFWNQSIPAEVLSPPPWDADDVAGCITNVRSSAERLRQKWEPYFNDIDPDDLANRLSQDRFSPEYDWGYFSNQADVSHQQAWDQVKVSDELRDLAVDGNTLYEAFFPPQSKLRGWLDALPAGALLDISWLDDRLSNIPWSLMYRQPPPLPGEEVEATAFLGLRYRIAYTAHSISNPSKSLGDPQSLHQVNFLYWGEHPNDATGTEARWQRQRWASLPNQTFIPAAGTDSTSRKKELLRFLHTPNPAPTGILYLFCQCKVGDGNDPVLGFGEDTRADSLRRTEIGGPSLAAQPLVFANACTTASSDPFLANQLETGFFRRECRAFVGTETKVPIPLASRFATTFFEFLHRRVDPEPMAAGEALSQARIFLWTRYRNLGGLFYTYINQYELFLASDAEIAARLRA